MSKTRCQFNSEGCIDKITNFENVATLESILDSHSENLASFILQDGATEWRYFLVWTIPHPPTPQTCK